MSRKKKFNGFTKEEIELIKKKAEENVRRERIIQCHKGRVDIIPELLRMCITKQRWTGYLDSKFIFELYKYLINNSDLTEDEKSDIEYTFATDYLFTCNRGVSEGTDIGKMISDMREYLKKYRES